MIQRVGTRPGGWWMRAAVGLLVVGTVAADAAAPPKPTVLARGLTGNVEVTADGTDVYWTCERGVFRKPRGGGPAKRLSSKWASPIAVDASTIFFSGEDGIWKLPKAGGKAVKLVEANSFPDLTLDGEYVYFSDKAGALQRVAKEGRRSEVVVQLRSGWELGAFTFDASAYYLIVFNLKNMHHAVQRVERSSANPTTIFESDRDLNLRIWVDATHVYFAQESKKGCDGRIARMPKTIVGSSGKPEVLVAKLCAVQLFALDDGFVYFAATSRGRDEEEGNIFRVPVGGGSPEKLLLGATMRGHLAIDQDRLYWFSEREDGYALVSLPKAPAPAAPR